MLSDNGTFHFLSAPPYVSKNIVMFETYLLEFEIKSLGGVLESNLANKKVLEPLYL